MKYKTQCMCRHPAYYKDTILHRLHDLDPCDENHEVERELSLDLYDGEFSEAIIWADDPNSEDLSEYKSDIYVGFKCSCGDEISLSEFGYSDKVCSCGRVYRLSCAIEKNDTHKNDMEYWDKIKKEQYKRYD